MEERRIIVFFFLDVLRYRLADSVSFEAKKKKKKDWIGIAFDELLKLSIRSKVKFDLESNCESCPFESNSKSILLDSYIFTRASIPPFNKEEILFCKTIKRVIIYHVYSFKDYGNTNWYITRQEIVELKKSLKILNAELIIFTYFKSEISARDSALC